MKAYVRAAVDSEIETLRRTSSGRACQAFRSAAAIGGFVGSGEVDRASAESLLLAAAMETGLLARAAISHIRRGLRRGEMTPRVLPHDPSDRRSPRPPLCPSPLTERPPERPPTKEVAALWAASRPVTDDPDVVGWFGHRFGDQATLVIEGTALWDLARAIPPALHVPHWARSRGGAWTQTGHRILFRLWDSSGLAASVRVRCSDPATTPKSLAPAGCSVKGLVLADPLGVQLLSGEAPSWWNPREVVIAEGEPAWLAWSSRQPEAHEQGPACFGIGAGAWSREIAGRVPDEARVALRTHDDEPGQRYAEQVIKTLGGRCHLFRSQPEEEALG